MRPSVLGLALMLGAALAPGAQAVTLYDESVGGDLGGDQASPRLLGDLQSGLNTFLGFDSRATDGPGGQGDGFAMQLLQGQTLSSVDFTVSNYTGTDPFVITFYRVATASPPVGFRVYQRFGATTGNQTRSFAIPSGLSTERLGFSVQLATATNPATGFNWRWDVQVASAVPEPATAGLMLAGLAGLALGRWRRGRRTGAAG